MRRLLFFTAIVTIIAILATGTGCGDSGITGKYVDRDYPDRYHVELYKDGTFHMKEDKVSYDGTWKVDGDQLTFSLDSGRKTTATIKENRINFENGDVLVKQTTK